MEILKWTVTVGLAVVMALNSGPLAVFRQNREAPATGTKARSSTQEAPEGMVKAAENDSLTLYINEEDTSVAVVDNDSGKTWYTNPADADSDSVASTYYKNMLKSQIQVQYYNSLAQSSVMNNYSESISKGQFEIEYLEDGVCVTYTMGEIEETLLLPDALSEDRYLEITSRMDESTASKVGRYYRFMDVEGNALSTSEEQYLETYPGFADENFYVIRNNIGAYMLQQLADLFAEAGYTAEDYYADLEASGAEVEENPWFNIPLQYTLDGENLVVSIDPEAVTYNEDGYYLVDIDVLPYFGAASEGDGYIFVPDGCGALIYLNNGKNTSMYPSYYGKVYGDDVSTQYMSTSKSGVDTAYSVKLPVFGIKADDQALFAIIEDGQGYADISADVSGRTSTYNNVYAGFSYLQYGAASLTDRLSSSSGYNLYSSGDFTGIYQIRYAFLSGDDADYSGMANYYRDYLASEDLLVEGGSADTIPFYTQYIGAIDKYKTLLGFRYSAVVSLTTFAQAEEIVDELKSRGIDDQVMIYSGWMNGGLHGTAATKVKTVKALEKDGVSLQELQSDMEDSGIDTFMMMDLQYVYNDQLFDGYTAQQYGPSYFDRSEITIKSYNLADGSEAGDLANLISPYYAGKVTNTVSKFTEKNQISGLNLGSASWLLYSDFRESRYTDRQAAIGLYEESFEELLQSAGQLLGDNGNDYRFPYVQYMVDAPLYSNGYRILDEEVPFYEMVIHGYISYAGEAINLSDDYETTLLKSIECGAGLYFEWIYEDNSLLKETDYDYLYSVYYGDWIDQAAEDYQKVASVLAGLEGQQIVQHEIIDENVRITTYEDGTEIIVNYGSNAAEVNGTTVGAMDFAVVKEVN